MNKIKNRSRIIIIFLFLLFSCIKNGSYIDVEGPVLEDFYYKDKSVMFQFNEPVKTLNVFFKNNGKEYIKNINNIFPVANNFIPVDFLINDQNITFSLEAIDTSNNKSIIDKENILININPAKLLIKKINFKYSKKYEQKIFLSALKSGYSTGFNLIVFENKKKIIFPFSNEFLTCGNELEILITNKIENSSENNIIQFSKKIKTLYLKNKLSQIQGCIYIMNSNDEIDSYFLYYNLKKHDLNYFTKNKSFNYFLRELKSGNIQKPLINNILI